MTDHDNVRSVYHDLLAAWNRRSGQDFGAQFAEDGEVVGFDGSETKGRAAIASEMQRIFLDHETGRYVGKVRQVRQLTRQIGLLRPVAAVVPAGASDLNPAVKSIQSVVLQKAGGRWLSSLCPNNPARVHGRPEVVNSLTDELRQPVR